MAKKNKVVIITSILLCLVIIITACGNSKSNESLEGNIDEESSSSDEISNQGEPREGGSVVLGITQEPDSLDPYLAAAAGTKEIIYNFFDGLVKLMPDSTFEPALAETYEVTEDAKEYTFKIKEDIKFHNNKELTVSDVEYSLNRAAGLEAGNDLPLIPQLSVIEKVVSDSDSNTVKVSLNKPDADFISYMTLAIIPEGYDNQSEHPIGTGPFIFAEYARQQHLKMKRNEDYWRERNAYLDEVVFLIMPSADAAMIDLQAGNIDIFPYLTMDKADLLKENYDFITADSNMVQIWGLNNEREPFDDPLVRQAINMAIDKQMIIDTVTFGKGQILESGMGPAMGKYYNADLKNDYNQEEAKKMLEEAGYRDLKINITVPGNYVIHVQTAEVIAAQLELIGVTTNIISVDWGTWLSDVYQGKDHDSTVIALTFDYAAPSTVLHHYYTNSDGNFINYSNEKFDSLYEKAQSETDQTVRVDLFHQMQKILQDDMASIFIQNPGTQTAVSKKLGGYTTYPQYVQDMYNVYFKAE